MDSVDGLSPEQKSMIEQVDKAMLDAERSKLPDRRLHQIYVCLAFEMFEMDLEERGFGIISKIDKSYFQNYFQADINEDEQFRYIVGRIMSKLIEIGLVKHAIGEKNEKINS